MSTGSKFIQVNKNTLIEINYNVNNNGFDYNITTNVHDKTFSILPNTNIPGSINALNTIDNELFLVDKALAKYAPVDLIKYPFLHNNKYTNNANTSYDRITIWFPINYNFSDVEGLYLNVFGLDYNNTNKYSLLNFFLDKSNVSLYNNIELAQRPFRINNKLWGKSISFEIPSLYYEARQRTNNKPITGTINDNLTGGIGFSTSSSIFFDFRFLYSKQTVLDNTYYLTTSESVFSAPQIPDNKELSVSINPADDGDYFIINGKYNGSIGGLVQYMENRVSGGNPSYILYSITLYENNMPQTTKDIYVYQNYELGINDYRPVIKYTNTLASIRVDMKLISMVNDDVTIKTAEYILTGNEIAKYGKKLTAININNSIKPKIYNSSPVQVKLPSKDIINSYFKRKSINKLDIKYVPYPVLFDSATIAVKSDDNINRSEQNDNIFQYDELNIELTPFDNVFEFNIVSKYDNSSYKPYEIPTKNTVINMVFKYDKKEIRINLYNESNRINLKSGAIVFKISKLDLELIRNISNYTNAWYITLTTNNIETVLYMGRFVFNTYKNINNNQNTTISNKISKAINNRLIVNKYKKQLNILKLNTNFNNYRDKVSLITTKKHKLSI